MFLSLLLLSTLTLTFTLTFTLTSHSPPPPSQPQQCLTSKLASKSTSSSSKRARQESPPHAPSPKQGITNFAILEYKDEIGGRIRHTNFGQKPDGSGPYIVELGANWIHGTSQANGTNSENPIWTLAQKYDAANYAKVHGAWLDGQRTGERVAACLKGHGIGWRWEHTEVDGRVWRTRNLLLLLRRGAMEEVLGRVEPWISMSRRPGGSAKSVLHIISSHLWTLDAQDRKRNLKRQY
jgi:hypothetical protein